MIRTTRQVFPKRLTKSIFDYEDESNNKILVSYHSGSRVKQRMSIYTDKITEYKAGTSAGVASGIPVPDSAPKEITKLKSDTSTSTYDYDAKGNLTSYTYTYKNFPATKMVFHYNSSGMLETK